LGLGTVSMVLEKLFGKLERYLGKTHLGKTFLQVLYREIVILGLVSFTLFMIRYGGENILSEGVQNVFEFVGVLFPFQLMTDSGFSLWG